jgi:hypothetical protein
LVVVLACVEGCADEPGPKPALRMMLDMQV